MAHYNQIEFLKQNVDKVKDPILIVGGKMYEYDHFNLKTELSKLGLSSVFVIDLESGEGVDKVLDITDSQNSFIEHHAGHFNTVICMEVLTYVAQPFEASKNMARLTNKGGHVIVSECFVRKLSKMPVDYWRFSWEGLKNVYHQYDFYPERAKKSLIRHKGGKLLGEVHLPEEYIAFKKHKNESTLHFYFRRFLRKFLSKDIFLVSRFFPEQSIYGVGRKK